MTHRQLARIYRALRIRAGLRQADVAARAGVGRWKVVLVEAGDLGRLRLGEIEACFEALGARLSLEASWRGAGLDRLLDEGHARMVGQTVGILRRLGWKVEVEVSFAIFGDRGSIDVFGWHEGEHALVVVEIKSELGAMDGLLRPLDVKVRHAAQIGRERFGWQARSVSRRSQIPLASPHNVGAPDN